MLPREIHGYAARVIFNADETGLIYRALQSGTLLFEGDKLAGGKVPKEHLTALASVNMDGTERDLWIIGKCNKLRCFSRVRNLPLHYYRNKKAWMTSIIWTDILTKMKRKYR